MDRLGERDVGSDLLQGRMIQIRRDGDFELSNFGPFIVDRRPETAVLLASCSFTRGSEICDFRRSS